jgi:hypothetical protein
MMTGGTARKIRRSNLSGYQAPAIAEGPYTFDLVSPMRKACHLRQDIHQTYSRLHFHFRMPLRLFPNAAGGKGTDCSMIALLLL